jgi:hypothetical protein
MIKYFLIILAAVSNTITPFTVPSNKGFKLQEKVPFPTSLIHSHFAIDISNYQTRNYSHIAYLGLHTLLLNFLIAGLEVCMLNV